MVLVMIYASLSYSDFVKDPVHFKYAVEDAGGVKVIKCFTEYGLYVSYITTTPIMYHHTKYKTLFICVFICHIYLYDTCISCVTPGKVQDAVCCNVRGLMLLMHGDSEGLYDGEE